MQRVRSSAIALFAFLTASVAAGAEPASGQKSAHGFLGILVSPANDGNGIMVNEVTTASPAAKAGMKRGDVIVKMANEAVSDVGKFLQAIAAKKPGDNVALVIRRDGKEQDISVALGEQPAREALGFPPGLRRPAFLGVHAEPMTPELKSQLNTEVETGAVITDVVPDSPAAKAGLKRDDVITAVNGRPVKSPMDLHEEIQSAGAGKEVTLQTVHGKEKRTVKATLQEGGMFPFPGERRFPTFGGGPMFDPNQRVRDLERKIEVLEKRIRELEKK